LFLKIIDILIFFVLYIKKLEEPEQGGRTCFGFL
jgi:hypothetical protein